MSKSGKAKKKKRAAVKDFHRTRSKAFNHIRKVMFSAGLCSLGATLDMMAAAACQAMKEPPPVTKEDRWRAIVRLAGGMNWIDPDHAHRLLDKPVVIVPVTPSVPKPKKAKKFSFAKFNAFYHTKEWQKLRFKAFLEHGRKCMCCNATDKVLHVDHIKPRSKYPELELSLENLQILCEDCNMGKGGWSEADFRESNNGSEPEEIDELTEQFRERMAAND